MKAARCVNDRGYPDHTPLPGRQLQAIVVVWHVLFLGSLALALAMLYRHGPRPPWPPGGRELAITLAVLTQAGVYVWVFIVDGRWPQPGWRLGGYFAIELSLWLLEWHLEPEFFWIGFTFCGQMFAMLSPWFSVPGMLAITGSVIISQMGWQRLIALPMLNLVGMAVPLAAGVTTGVFIYLLSRTNSARGRLVVELAAAKARLEAARDQEAELARLRERERLAGRAPPRCLWSVAARSTYHRRRPMCSGVWRKKD